MVEIIKRGKERYINECHRCGCRFTYSAWDLFLPNMVLCPECGIGLPHDPDADRLTAQEDDKVVTDEKE